MARSDVRAFDRGAPDWLRRIVDDPLKLPAQNKGHIDHYRASALTLIAQMALAIWQQLPQEIET